LFTFIKPNDRDVVITADFFHKQICPKAAVSPFAPNTNRSSMVKLCEY